MWGLAGFQRVVKVGLFPPPPASWEAPGDLLGMSPWDGACLLQHNPVATLNRESE